MINRTTKLRWRRKYRLRRRQVEDYSQQAEDQIDKHFFKRLNRIVGVRRFVISWLLLFIILISISITQTYGLSSYYQKLQPTSGGSFTEGILGNFTNSNPLYASSNVDSSVSKLLFPSLFKYNQNNSLVGDLAQSYAVDDRGLNYTVILKDNLTWQDGKPLTSQDIVFTYNEIENPDVGSPLFNEWSGVKTIAINANTVKFTLPGPLSSFPYNMTNGIIPQHVLSKVQPLEMRSSPFNTTSPVGAGPFKLTAIDVAESTPETYMQKIGFKRNNLFYEGKSKLDRFVINTFNNQSQLVTSFNKGELNGIADLPAVPVGLNKGSDVIDYNIPLTAEVMVFFNTQQAVLSDVKVRQALVQAVDVNKIINGLGYPVIPSRSPLLPFQVGYSSTVLQLPTNLIAANQELDQNGWLISKNGIRFKNGIALSFNLYTQDNSEFSYVSKSLKTQWRKIGAKVEVLPQQATDLQNAIKNHGYDSLLYGISIGVDPDVFAYWDSSQALPNATPGLNLSLYKNSAVDSALEGGRTRIDPSLRAIKYLPFLNDWKNDAPALALYQPRYFYITRGFISGFTPTLMNIGTDRLSNVNNWEVREVRTTN